VRSGFGALVLHVGTGFRAFSASVRPGRLKDYFPLEVLIPSFDIRESLPSSQPGGDMDPGAIF